MTPLPKVSVITPSLNQAEFLEETLRSVLSQDYPDLEYIVIDGGSTDGSLEILRQYNRSLASWVSEPDRGQSHALNKGFRRASGEIVGWLNADDLYCPNAVRQGVAALLEHPEAAAVYSDALWVDRWGATLDRLSAGQAGPIQLLTGAACVPAQAAFFRKSALEAVGLVDESLHLVMDQELCFRLSLRYPLVHLPGRVLAHIRVHPAAKTSAQAEKMAQEMDRMVAKAYRLMQGASATEWPRRSILARCAYYHVIRGAFQHNLKATLLALGQSLLLDPRYVCTRPRHAAYLLKVAAVGARQAV